MCIKVIQSSTRYVPRLKVRGIEILRDPQTNKGTSYTLRERQFLGIHGLLPPNHQNQEVEVQRVLANLYQLDDNLSRYGMLMSLQDRSEKLFYKTIRKHLDYCLPLIYTPTVASACLNFGCVFRRPRGLYVTIQDRGHVYDLLKNWPSDSVKVVAMTDGERIMGFGDLGANGMAIPLSKVNLYVALGGMQPHHCLPIMLDVGTDNEELLKDEFYVGVRRKRAHGDEFISFMDETIEALTAHYGKRLCLHLTDLKNDNAFHFLNRYQSKYTIFDNDIQGSAVAVLAGLMTCSKVTNINLSKNKYLFYGASGATVGLSRLLTEAIINESGCSEAEAKACIYVIDSNETQLTNSSASNLVSEFIRPELSQMDSLIDVIRLIKPNVLIGASDQHGAFTREILREMSIISKTPIIFTLSTLEKFAECTAEIAYKSTEWNCIFVSGCAFDAVHSPDGRVLHPGQGNNCYVFPGLITALVRGMIHPVTNDLLLAAAKSISDQVTAEDLSRGNVYPAIENLPTVSRQLAYTLLVNAFEKKLANFSPEPEDKMAFIDSYYYEHDYVDFSPEQFVW